MSERGRTGATGKTGAEGERGRTGHAGPLPRRVTLAFVILFVAVAVALVRLEQLNHDHARQALEQRTILCQELEKVKRQLVVAIEDGKANIPKIQYYRDHPDELAAALQRSNRTIQRFAPIDCVSFARRHGLDVAQP